MDGAMLRAILWWRAFMHVEYREDKALLRMHTLERELLSEFQKERRRVIQLRSREARALYRARASEFSADQGLGGTTDY